MLKLWLHGTEKNDSVANSGAVSVQRLLRHYPAYLLC